MSAPVDVTGYSEKQLIKTERAIARKYMGGMPWVVVAWGLGNCVVWLALWPLVYFDILPLWAGFLIATVNVTLSYLPSHEAQHSIIARDGEPLRWLNELVGHISTIPLATPYRALRVTHMEHHTHSNDPELDPDYSSSAKNAKQAIWKSLINRQPRAAGGFNKYGEVLTRLDTPEAKRALRDSIIYQLVFYSLLIGLAWSGYALMAALLWWLPRHIGLTYIQFFLSWAPHHPAKETGRYRDTRAFRSRLGNIGSGGMQFHIVHHLHPRIPLTRTPAAYWELRPILKARGCDLGEL